MENFPQMEKKTDYLNNSRDSMYPRLWRVASREIQSSSQKWLRGNSSLYLHLSENGEEIHFIIYHRFTSNFSYVAIFSFGFPGGSVVKNSSVNAGDMGSIPRLGRSPGEGNGNQFQYSCLGNPMDRGAWQATSTAELGHDWARTHAQTREGKEGQRWILQTQLTMESVV